MRLAGRAASTGPDDNRRSVIRQPSGIAEFVKPGASLPEYLGSRQRVEVRPGDHGSFITINRVPRRQETFPMMEPRGPATRVFRENRASPEIESSVVGRIESMVKRLEVIPGERPPQLNLNQVTDQVMREIDRRMVIWRERTGRV